jgi:hypothetical protein
LCYITQDYPNRQILKGLGKKKGTPRKEERYSYNKAKRSPYIEKRKLV